MQMKPVTLSLSLLLMFFIRVQGIVLEQASAVLLEEQVSIPLGQQKIHEEKEWNLVGEVLMCRKGHCSGGSRKLMTKTRSTSKIVKSKDVEVEGLARRKELDKNREEFSVKSTVSERKYVPGERYPDIVDIAGMDYAPAKRKPPIHN